MSYNFPVTRTTNPKPKPDQSNLGFGKYFTDHMFIMDYDEGQGWHDGKIVPYGPISLDPASCVLHYAQMMFEGMKAYLTPDKKINLFRPDMNAKRLNRTNERMCIPYMDEELFVEAVKAIVQVTGFPAPPAPRCTSGPTSSPMRSPSPWSRPNTTTSSLSFAPWAPTTTSTGAD